MTLYSYADVTLALAASERYGISLQRSTRTISTSQSLRPEVRFPPDASQVDVRLAYMNDNHFVLLTAM